MRRLTHARHMSLCMHDTVMSGENMVISHEFDVETLRRRPTHFEIFKFAEGAQAVLADAELSAPRGTCWTSGP